MSENTNPQLHELVPVEEDFIDVVEDAPDTPRLYQSDDERINQLMRWMIDAFAEIEERIEEMEVPPREKVDEYDRLIELINLFGVRATNNANEIARGEYV